MTFQTIVDNLVTDTLQVSLVRFRPELALCVGMVLLLLMRFVKGMSRVDPFVLALPTTIVALLLTVPVEGFSGLASAGPQEIFTGMLVYDGVTVFLRTVLVLALLVVAVLSKLTSFARREDGEDLYVLLFGATLGMCLMVSSNHWMMIFMGVEMASVPSYVLVGMARRNRQAGEAAMKYAVFGAGASGVMLYGISLLVGIAGSAHLPTMAIRLAALDLPGMMNEGQDLGTIGALVLGGLMVTAGVAFKLSAVPFHFWCPDAFEGATAEVAGFLSVASKAAAVGLLVRLTLGLCSPGAETAAEQMLAESPPAGVHLVADSAAAVEETAPASPLSPVRTYLAVLIAVLAAVTCTFGNLAAFGQSNMKRLLAYSTIAHAGYMMMPVAAAALLSGSSVLGAQQAAESVLIYVGIYLFMNLAAFAFVACLRDSLGSEQVDDYEGLVHSSPVIAICMVLLMAGLVGIPPLAGFLGKFAIFAVLAEAGTPLMTLLLIVAALNTVLSLVYYWRVVRTMCVAAEPVASRPAVPSFLETVFGVALTIPVVLLFIFPSGVVEFAHVACEQLLQ